MSGGENPKYLIEFIDSSTSEDSMWDSWNILLVDGKSATSIASCWDETVAHRILAGFEMLDMLDSGVVPGVPSRRLEVKKASKPRTRTSGK